MTKTFTKSFSLFILFYVVFSSFLPLFSQKNKNKNAEKNNEKVVFSPLETRQKAVTDKKILRQNSIFSQYPLRNIGACVMGGRVVDLAVNEQNPLNFYVAYASGGIWKTENNGQSFTPIFDNQARMTIGDIAIHPQNPNILWVGTGENNSSRSSYAGFGVYRTTNAGKNWEFLGLENTQHIGRIVLHPKDENIAFVASIGALYSKNQERGVYKTIDGGRNWKKTLFVNDSTGVIDLIMHPTNPNFMWATAWERHRQSNNFKEKGKGSGLYFSENGGETWTLQQNNGLPSGENMGRMGIAIAQSNPDLMYLVLDNQESQSPLTPKGGTNTNSLTSEGGISAKKYELKDFKEMKEEDFFKIDNVILDSVLKENKFPPIYTAQSVKNDIRNKKYPIKSISEYFKNGNDDLFNTVIAGCEVYASKDMGKSWQKINQHNLDGVFYTYGYYFGQIFISPQNPEIVYIMGVPLLKSTDGGKNFIQVEDKSPHADHHALWINPKNDKNIILGNDGGVYISYDAGENFTYLNNMPVGQYYTVNFDLEKPYNVYGGLQDNGVWVGSSKSKPQENANWKFIMGGDGMMVAPHPQKGKDLVYTGYQFGNYYRLENGKETYITPKRQLGKPALRFNWRTPLVMSKHNPDVLYICSQKVHRSMQKGENWEEISEDLTKNQAQKNVPFNTISAFAESPKRFGLLYAGTDDGNVWISKNGGEKWDLITKNLPKNLWVGSIYPSSEDEKVVFLAMTGYRNDDINAYLYKSVDFGQNWQEIKGNLPNESVNVIMQDLKKPEILYIGTDEGLYISLNEGKSWENVAGIMPNVAVYDLAIHPREQELIIATHGRSIYIMPLAYLHQLSEKFYDKKGSFADDLLSFSHIFSPNSLKYNKSWGKKTFGFMPENNPQVELWGFLGENTSNIVLEIQKEGKTFAKTPLVNIRKGFFQCKILLKDENGNFLEKGDYDIVLKNFKTKEIKTTFKIY